MFDYDIKDILSKHELMNPYSDQAKKLYDKTLEYFQPETCLIVFSSPRYENTMANKERWYGTQYSSHNNIHITSHDKLETLTFDLQLPKENEFIPTDFKIKDETENTYPNKISEYEGIECWMKFTKKYGLPKACILIDLYKHDMGLDIKDRMLIQLYISSKNDELNKILYPASVAGLTHNVSYSPMNSIISLVLGGYNQNLHRLLLTCVTEYQKGLINKKAFDRTKEIFHKHLRNKLLSSPYILAREFLCEEICKFLY